MSFARNNLILIAFLGLALAAATIVATSADAAPATDQKCKQSKLGASAAEAAARFNCLGHAAGKGVQVDPKCVAKSESALVKTFAKTDAKGGCSTIDDAPAVEAGVDGCVTAIAAALGSPAPANRCLQGKVGAAGKKAAAKLRCAARAAAKSLPVDPKCLARAEKSFASTWARLETKGGCVTVGDADAVEAIVDDGCVLPIQAALGSPTPTPTPTATPVATPTATPRTVSFGFTGSEQDFVVPPGVTSVTVEADGASGGFGGSNGGSVTATIRVTPGETLAVFVGGLQGPLQEGGYNGGGHGGGAEDNPGGGGGGASDVRQGGIALTDRVVVAGGGGGAPFGLPGLGGSGGGLAGSAGQGSTGFPGGGGTQAAGGLGGGSPVECSGEDGALGAGGDGSLHPGQVSVCSTLGGGGGGGGYYGGGGAGAAGGPAVGIHTGGGGGGSSYAIPTATGVTMIGGGSAGAMVTIAW